MTQSKEEGLNTRNVRQLQLNLLNQLDQIKQQESVRIGSVNLKDRNVDIYIYYLK